jgi:prepilin-type N-terminal cleavage/methylation domain-containing protein
LYRFAISVAGKERIMHAILGDVGKGSGLSKVVFAGMGERARIQVRRHDGIQGKIFPAQDDARRAGFTLVEVIVVLVILAILAAIAIPSLTGYIDKAKWRDMELRAKTQMTAMQVMLNEKYARDGGFTTHSITNPAAVPPGEYFLYVLDYASKQGYNMYFWSPYGLEEYEKLTGDTSSFGVGSAPSSPRGNPAVITDRSGAIKLYSYRINYYFPAGERRHLYVIYIVDTDSSDPLVQARINDYAAQDANFKKEIKVGMNVFQYDDSSPYTGDTFVRLN